jgi:transcriptional regulator with PAS, ATPase and Fis domain
VLLKTTANRGFAGIIGCSAPMLDVFRMVETVCRTNSTVLISGESGTGKELVAKAVHSLSLRKDKPFVALNCGAMPETLVESELFGHVRGAFTGADTNKKGLVEVADGGSLLLDEIGEMSTTMQVKLLRVLQERSYRRVGGTEEIAANIRVIAATNNDLPKLVSEGRFREDLFYRLNVIPLVMPALRDRVDDILLIADHFLSKFSKEMGKALDGFSPEAAGLLKAYPWPGNVRELENVVERAVALEMGEEIGLESLPFDVKSPQRRAAADMAVSLDAGGMDLEAFLEERRVTFMREALRRTGGVQSHAARLLGMTFRSFRYFAKKHDLGGRAEVPEGEPLELSVRGERDR